jgi:hypothetical protein
MMSPTEEARRQRKVTNIALLIMAGCMMVVIIGTVVIIGLVLTGNTTTSRLDDSATLAGCRAASTARLNGARVQTDHAQNAVLLGIGVQNGFIEAKEFVRAADEALTKAEQQYQNEYDLSNKDKQQFIKDCRARGDI